MITIRPATPADVPLILGFIRELAEYERAPHAVVATEDLLHQHLFGAGLGRGPIAECLMGLVNGVPEGFAVFFHNFSTWTGRPGVYLEDLFVRPSARGVGLGKALFAAVGAIAKARGCARYEWSVLDWNTPAIEFYTHFGASPMSEWTVHRMTEPAITALAAVARDARN
jgi:GNAT superfamily N-acetyltransferase